MNNSSAHTALVQNIRLALGNEQDLTLWPMQPGGVADATGRPMRCGPNGMADLCGILAPQGRWFCLEAKTGAGKQRPDQIMWGNLIRKRCGFYAVVRSVEDATAALARARLGFSS